MIGTIMACGPIVSKSWPINQGTVMMEPVRASINQEECSGCRICNALCPFNAIDFDEEKKVSRVNEAICKGCGVCTASCRMNAVALNGFNNEEVLAQIYNLN